MYWCGGHVAVIKERKFYKFSAEAIPVSILYFCFTNSAKIRRWSGNVKTMHILYEIVNFA